jgi:hypothetical protein
MGQILVTKKVYWFLIFPVWIISEKKYAKEQKPPKEKKKINIKFGNKETKENESEYVAYPGYEKK